MNVLLGHIITWCCPPRITLRHYLPTRDSTTTERRPPSASINTAEKSNRHEPAVGSGPRSAVHTRTRSTARQRPHLAETPCSAP